MLASLLGKIGGSSPPKPDERCKSCALCGAGSFQARRPAPSKFPYCYNPDCPHKVCVHEACLGHVNKEFSAEQIRDRADLVDQSEVPTGWGEKLSALQVAALNAGMNLEKGQFSEDDPTKFMELMNDTAEGTFCVEAPLAPDAVGPPWRLRILGFEPSGGVRYCCSSTCATAVQEKQARRNAATAGLRSAGRAPTTPRVAFARREDDEIDEEHDGSELRSRRAQPRDLISALSEQGELDLDALVPSSDPAFPSIREDLQAMATPVARPLQELEDRARRLEQMEMEAKLRLDAQRAAAEDLVPPVSGRGGAHGDVSPERIRQATATLGETHDPSVARRTGLEPALAEVMNLLGALCLRDFLVAEDLTTLGDLKSLSGEEQAELIALLPQFGNRLKLKRLFARLNPGAEDTAGRQPSVSTGGPDSERRDAPVVEEINVGVTGNAPPQVAPPARSGTSGNKWPSSSVLPPSNASAWAALLAVGQNPDELDPEVAQRLEKGLPIPPLCLSPVAGAKNEPTTKDLEKLLAVDLALAASYAGKLQGRRVLSLYTIAEIQQHCKLMRIAKLFLESGVTDTHLEGSDGAKVLTTSVKLTVNPIPLDEWYTAEMEVYFKYMLYSLNMLGLHHLVPALLWMQAWSFGRDMSDLGASTSSGFMYNDKMADLMLSLRKAKLLHLREMLTGERSRGDHPAASWVVTSAERIDWAREGLGVERKAPLIRVPGPMLPRAADIPSFSPDDVWNNKKCLNCQKEHCVYDCPLPRRENLPCTNCFWGVHHESACQGEEFHPLRIFQNLKAQDAVKRRKAHK